MQLGEPETFAKGSRNNFETPDNFRNTFHSQNTINLASYCESPMNKYVVLSPLISPKQNMTYKESTLRYKQRKTEEPQSVEDGDINA